MVCLQDYILLGEECHGLQQLDELLVQQLQEKCFEETQLYLQRFFNMTMKIDPEYEINIRI